MTKDEMKEIAKEFITTWETQYKEWGMSEEEINSKLIKVEYPRFAKSTDKARIVIIRVGDSENCKHFNRQGYGKWFDIKVWIPMKLITVRNNIAHVPWFFLKKKVEEYFV